MIWHWIINWVIGWGGIGTLVAICAWLLWYFTPPFLVDSKSLILHVAVGATIFVGASTYFFTSGYNKGYAVAIHAIAAKDQKAINEADHAKQTVQDCFSGGGTWDVSDGVCTK